MTKLMKKRAKALFSAEDNLMIEWYFANVLSKYILNINMIC